MTVDEWQCENMFMSFRIRVAPFFAIVSWDFFRSFINLSAVFFGFFDLSKIFIAFCIRGSVGLVFRIFFADFLSGFIRNALIPALATFSAPWILTDFMSDNILLKRLVIISFFIYNCGDECIKNFGSTKV